MKSLVKSLLYAAGLARLWHRWRNHAALTVVMFHRVLPPEDSRFAGANPTYTVTPGELDRYLGFFRRFYSVVSLGDVERAAEGAALPPCPLLITFDDGWQDNAEYALPVLRAHGMPAVLFVATGHVGREDGFWQEEVFDRIAAGAPQDDGWRAADAAVAELQALPAGERARRITALAPRALPRRMADAQELREMQQGGISIGGHGESHEPLTAVPDASAEFLRCRERLAELGLGGARPAFSFPHGRWTPRLVEAARAAGFGLCFTSEAELTPVRALRPDAAIGRVAIGARQAGRADIPGLAFSLLTRAHTAPT
ncbi:polysaccharide deacetylase family protein [Roseomonas rosulenta]|uniref:polysaccharide deacetylase family protein n=1 Tax=Roseomonas rosulenta TaxID=2748667 RepID=UPI0018DFCA16